MRVFLIHPGRKVLSLQPWKGQQEVREIALRIIRACREMGIAVEAPDINVSDANFTPHGESIRFGLAAVKNVGGNAIESIVAGNAPYDT